MALLDMGKFQIFLCCYMLFYMMPHIFHLRAGADNSTCIFNADSPLYTQGFRDTFRPVDSLVNSCEDLDQFWTYLIGLMSLSFIGFVVSLVAIFSDCIAPCAEEKYHPESRTEI